MKKITLLLALFLTSIIVQSQTTLSQSVDPATIDESGVVCWNPSNGEYRDNAFVRTYDLASFGITVDWEITEVEFGQGGGSEGKVIQINIYTSDSEDMTTATLTSISSTDVTIQSANDMTLVTVPITGTIIPANSIVVVEIFAPDEGTVPDLTFFPGFNLAGENNTPWLKSDGCSISWTDANNVVPGSPQPYVINITGSDAATASILDNLAELTQIYPNPVSDRLEISIPSNVKINNAILFDLLGKNTGVILNNNFMDTSNLSAGIYFLNIKTDVGEITKKIIKR